MTKRAEVSHLRRRCARLEAAMCMISGCADLDELLDSLLGPDHEHEGEANG
ncbi:MAG TPA: hypothetical protein VM869_00455 [Enhygromyxa sp.]|nr:hypothetical protein [Enhygromyxa sp.]